MIGLISVHAARCARFVCVAIATCFASSNSFSQTRTFDGAGDGTSFNDPLNWSGNDVPNSPGEDAVIDAGGAFDVLQNISVNIGDLTLGVDDTLGLNSGFTLGLVGGDLTNDGVLTINSTAGSSNSVLDPNATLSIAGSGEIILNAGGSLADAQIGGATNDFAIFNGSGHSISGTGQIVTSFTNNGQVTANVNTAVLLLSGGNKTNAGSLAASGGGILRLQAFVDNTGGTIDPNNGLVDLLNATVTGGSITAGQVDVTGTSTLDSVTTAAAIDIMSGQNLTVTGTITNTGTITVNNTASSSNSILDPNSVVTFTGAGDVVLNAGGALPDAQVGGASNDFAITNDVGHTFRGTGQIINEFINDGTVTADVNGATLLLSGGVKTNNNVLDTANGGTLQIATAINNLAGSIDPNSGLIELSNAAITGGDITAGDINVIQASTLNTLSTASDINVVSGVNLVVNGAITNTGTITINSNGLSGNSILDPNSAVTFNGAGQVVLNAATADLADAQVGGATNDFQIINSAGHTFRGKGQIITAFINNGLVSADSSGNTLLLTGGIQTNNATLEATGGGNLRITTVVNNASGSIDADGGTVQLAAATINGGSVTGGQVDVTGTSTFSGVTNSATVDVVSGANLNVNGTITNTGTITINSNGLSSNSILDPNGTATFTGTGEVVLNATSDLADAQVGGATNDFEIINSAGHTFRGRGQIITAFINNGLVSADSSGNTLLLTGGIQTNNATLEATGGGNLRITTVVNNASGSIDADGGTVQLAAATINGGSVTGGQVDVTGTSTFSGVTNSATVDVVSGANLNVNGTITNTGTITINSNGLSSNSILDPNSAVTFNGTGEVVLNATSALADAQVGGATNDFQIINSAGHTFRGKGQIITAFINDGLVSADAGGATLLLSGGVKTNNGTYEALDGATLSNTAGLTNLSAGTLTGGTYRSVETGNGSMVTIVGTAVDTIAAGTNVELSGAAAVMTFGGTNLADSLVNNAGTLHIFNAHSFTMANALNNTGNVELGGAGLAAATLTSSGDITNAAGAEIFGHGTINNTILNSGSVRSANGTLSIVGGVIDDQSGTIQSDAGSTLDLSGASGDSDGDFLVNNGSLVLGANNVLVAMDYTNANFGIGNSFNHRTNVTGSGLILADPAVTQSLTGDVSGGGTATATMDFGNTRVGSPVALSYSINNNGASGPALRGAIQTDNTAGNGGAVTDARISGAGVTAANFGPISVGDAEGPLAVTFSATSAGALSGQQVAIANNFDNVANQVLQFAGAAYNPAIASLTPNPINLGNFHVGDAVPGQIVGIANNAVAGAFSEDLFANNFMASGDATVSAAPTFAQVVAGNNGNGPTVGVSTASAGNKSGAFTADLFSNGTVNGATVPGLGQLALGSANIPVTAMVYRLASPNLPVDPTHLGDFHVGDTITGSFVVENNAANDGFSESVQVQVTGFVNDAVLASGNATIAPGTGSGGALTVELASSAGAKSGTVEYSQTSLAAAAGLSNTTLGAGNAEITANVYELAVAQVGNSQPINFGIVHVGDSAPSVNLSINNNAQLGGFGENLDASFSSTPSGIIGTGAVTDLASQGNDSTSMTVSLDTSTAGVVSGNAVIDFVSDGTGINSLGQTALSSQNVAIQGQVNHFANPDFFKDAGNGVFSQTSATSYSLDFGTVLVGAAVQADLGLLNDVAAPADTLAGMFSTSGDAEFSFTNFAAFAGIGAGTSLDDLFVDFDTSAVGTFNGSLTLMPRSQNVSGFDRALSSLTINIAGTVAVVPEPSTCLLAAFGVFLGGGYCRFMVFATRRSSAGDC